MNKSERVKASDSIDRMLRTFSAARYEPDILVTFVTDCDEFFFAGGARCVRRISHWHVDGFNGAFPPSGAQFVSEVPPRPADRI